jgi:N-carbamoyl-L-amino-acid hydrolase
MTAPIDKEQLKSIFERLKQFNSNPSESGITRLAYSEQDQLAHRYLINYAEQLGLEVRQDAIGNVFMRLPGRQPDLPAIGSGSHIDTVPNGGAYDGAIGVLAAIYALSQFQPGQLNRSLEAVIFRAEESSRFGFACMGSKVMTGMSDLIKWGKNTDAGGKTFFQALADCGYHDDDISSCILPPTYFDAFIELHIEQGRVLESKNKRIGVVSGIAAPSRYRVDIHGHADHSGATPMCQRHDALVASACIIESLYTAASNESSYGTVGTVGKLDVYPNSMNVIPGDVRFYVDIRGVDEESISRLIKKLFASIEKTKIDHDVNIEILELSNDKPVLLDKNIASLIESECKQRELDWMEMISGAGHDAMYLAKRFPTCMIFIPSKDGVSHHPDEYSEFDDVFLGATLLTECLKKLANK